MSMSDPLGDMLTRIRNAQRAKKSEVVSPASRLRENVLEVLKKEGYIAGYEKVNVPRRYFRNYRNLPRIHSGPQSLLQR